MARITHNDEQTIIAQCTPQGSGAIALLRLCGADAIAIADHFAHLPSNKKLSEQTTHTIHYGSVIDDKNQVIDTVLFFLMRSPKTFTGQDTIEISCHNNPFLIEAIIQRALDCGARLAQNGEFTKRSFLYGKVDLMQAEAINELIHASTHMTLKQSLSQVEGSFSQWVTSIEKKLVKCLALSEASFEFIDEEDMAFGGQIQKIIDDVLSSIVSIKKTFDQQQHIRQGIRIALLGSVNAGKSSLFNALLNKPRAIVTDIAGTTRDALEAGLYVDGNYWTLIDTAGLRQTDDVIEKEGIMRSEKEAALADIIILVVDSSRTYTEQEKKIYADLMGVYNKKIIIVRNKTDLDKGNDMFLSDTSLSVSAEQKQNIDAVHKAIAEKIADLFAAIESPFLLNKRHFNLLITLEQKLHSIKEILPGDIAYELLSCHLQETLEHLSELTGKTISEQGMDAVFKEFCVGK